MNFEDYEVECSNCGRRSMYSLNHCPTCDESFDEEESEGPIWSWLCRSCDTNPVEHKLDTCEECLEKQHAACEVCSGDKDLEDIVYGLYGQYTICDICLCAGRAMLVDENVGHCVRCGEYGSRVNSQFGPLCSMCNNRGEL